MESERDVKNAMEQVASSDSHARKQDIIIIYISDCEGLGVQRSVIEEDIDLPPGVVDGQKLKIKGMGHVSDVFQGVPGDLLINLKVKPHTIFKR